MSYTRFDKFVANQRFRVAVSHLKAHSVVCDLGCGLAADFLAYAGARISRGVGVDYQIRSCPNGMSVICANITDRLPLIDSYFDHVVMLAVLEHLEKPQPVLSEVYRVLRPDGSLVLTWPHPIVDPLLTVLHRLGFVSKEMESQQHQRRIPLGTLVKVLSDIGFRRFFHRRFQFGLNNLLIASKKNGGAAPKGPRST